MTVSERFSPPRMLLLEESPAFSLRHEPLNACLYATWQGPHTGELTRVAYELILQHVYATQSTKLLIDGLADENGWYKITSWLAEKLFAQLAQAGIQVVAWVLPTNQQAFYDTFQVIHHLKQPLVDTFTDAEAAYKWLHRQALYRLRGLTANRLIAAYDAYQDQPRLLPA